MADPPPQAPIPRVPLPTVAITGASGALGQALLRRWQRRGAHLIALTHGSADLTVLDGEGRPIPLRQVRWQVGAEAELEPVLREVDVLVINHGINVYGDRGVEATDRSLSVNALSGWRLLELFAAVVDLRHRSDPQARAPGIRAEVWVNTSEAEIQPALSPLYEISKRLLGQLVSLRAPDLSSTLRIRRLVLGPFRSNLNPYGVMTADWVAGQILRQMDWDWGLIIVTPNPLTYVAMPLTTLGRWLYVRLLGRAGTTPPRNPDP